MAGEHGRRVLRGLLVLAGMVVSFVPPSIAEAAVAEEPVLVVLQDGTSAAAVADRADVDPDATFDTAIDGFAVDATPAELSRLRRDARVRKIVPNRRAPMVLAADPAPADILGSLTAQLTAVVTSVLQQLGLGGPGQTIPTSITRVGGLESPTARIDGRDGRVDATIAIVDTGVAPHPDLNLTGGWACTDEDHDGDADGAQRWNVDGYGHGTLVAGTAAAIDNGIGVVGVAPGARILSAKALDGNGTSTPAELLCAIEWAMEAPHDVDVMNISLGWRFGYDGEGAPCGTDDDFLHEAVCRAVEHGITVVVAAGNEGADASTLFPAAYPEVLTVSALADFDGYRGGLGPTSSCGGSNKDDNLWPRSNFGPSVDVAAVGVCVVTTGVTGGLDTATGTSLAAPAVSGAAALLRAGGARTPAEIRQRILAAAEPGPIAGDRDGSPEGVLRVDGF